MWAARTAKYARPRTSASSSKACGTASETMSSAPIAASSTTRTAPSSDAALLASHTNDSQANHSTARIAMPSKNRVHVASCATKPVTCVIAKTKTRSKNSSSAETSCSISACSSSRSTTTLIGAVYVDNCLDRRARAEARGLAQRLGLVGALPREVVVLAAEVAVGGGLLVDRAVELEVLPERARAQVEVLFDQGLDLGAPDLLGPERLDHDRHRVCDADRVGHLDLGALGQAGRDDVLGHVPGRVRGRAVDLRRVLAAERAAAVAGHAAVGVDDDLAPGQPGVAHRPADHEPAGRVDQQVLAQLAGVVEVVREDRLDDVLPEVVGQERLGAVAMLRRDQDLLDLDRPAVQVADGHLGLAIGAQV